MIPTENNGVVIGTPSDMAARLRMTLPNGWFPVSPPAPAASLTPVLDGVLAGLASAWSYCFSLLSAVVAQTRLATAYGIFLDLISADFFADAVPRQSGESDGNFRNRISQNLVNSRGTRAAATQAILTSGLPAPLIVEPERAPDCGGYATAQSTGSGGALGYGSSGLRYGSARMNFQYLIQITGRPSFAPGMTCQRLSSASFINANGAMQLVGPNVLRPSIVGGTIQGPLIEERSFNLIRDSRGWSWLTSKQGQGWSLQAPGTGILATDPTVSLSSGGADLSSIFVDVAAGGETITGSVWVMLPQDGSPATVQLLLTDLSAGVNVVTVANWQTVGTWQRLAVSLAITPTPGRTARMTLEVSGGSVGAVVTQCWQIELGPTASSYIPTCGELGIRNADFVSTVELSSNAVVLDQQQVFEAVESVIPAATIAWTAYSNAV